MKIHSRAMVLAAAFLLAGGCARNEGKKEQPPAPAKPSQNVERRTAAPPVPAPAPTPEDAGVKKHQNKKKELAAVSTKLRDKTPGRLQNIRLACQGIHGIIVPPGGAFSFNDALGERTAEKGYQEAIVFEEGEKEMAIGGGICQVSSTIYLAAQQAGLTVSERHPHQLPVPYVEEGQDAAVEYGRLDLVFQNSTSQSVLLEAWLTEDAVTVTLSQIQ